MATMSAGRIRPLCRRHNHAHEAVYHFSAIPVRHVGTGFSRPLTTRFTAHELVSIRAQPANLPRLGRSHTASHARRRWGR